MSSHEDNVPLHDSPTDAETSVALILSLMKYRNIPAFCSNSEGTDRDGPGVRPGGEEAGRADEEREESKGEEANEEDGEGEEIEEEEEEEEDGQSSAAIHTDDETHNEAKDIDRTPVIKGKPEPSKLNIRVPHKDHPEDRSRDHVHRFRRKNEVDWTDHKWITAINRWRSQVFRRKTGVKQRAGGVMFEQIERHWIIQRFRDEPKIGLTKLTKEFNAKFAGKVLQGCKKGPRPTRTQSAISSECARNPEIRKTRGKGEERLTERRREIRDLNAARKEKRQRAKRAKRGKEEAD